MLSEAGGDVVFAGLGHEVARVVGEVGVQAAGECPAGPRPPAALIAARNCLETARCSTIQNGPSADAAASQIMPDRVRSCSAAKSIRAGKIPPPYSFFKTAQTRAEPALRGAPFVGVCPSGE